MRVSGVLGRGGGTDQLYLRTFWEEGTACAGQDLVG